MLGELEEIPTTILTQFGIASCLPKLARGETRPWSVVVDPHGYCKRHDEEKKHDDR